MLTERNQMQYSRFCVILRRWLLGDGECSISDLCVVFMAVFSL